MCFQQVDFRHIFFSLFLMVLYCHPVHPRAAIAVASPDIEAVDIEASLDEATAEAMDDPEQVEDVDARSCHGHQC